LFFEVIEGLVAVEHPDRLLGEYFSGVFAGSAAGGVGGEPVYFVPFLLGEAQVEAVESGFFGLAGLGLNVLIHGINVLITKVFNQNIYI